MSGARFHLAQLNIARMRAPLGDKVMEGFESQLDRLNAVADQSPGFVWRLASEEGDATAIRAFPDERILVNMSVWESLPALHQYVYRSPHLGPLRDRRDWFEPMEGPHLVLWWIAAGSIPTVDEGKAKLEELARRGPTEDAFTFRQPFPAPGEAPGRPPEVEAEFCHGPA
jgi:Domain of unknown function (DUF3291)